MEKTSRRGRKPKIFNVQINKDREQAPISSNLKEISILHLPITLDEILKNSNKFQDKNDESIMKILTEVPASYHNKYVQKDVDKQPVKPLTKVKNYTSITQDGYPEIIKIYNNIPVEHHINNDGIIEVKIEYTDVACWWCCYQFDTYPICAPTSFDHKKKCFKVIGCFCSFNCSKAYLEDLHNKKQYDFSLNSFLYKQLTGSLKHIKRAPPRTVLKFFGGPLDISEFRNSFDTLDTIKVNTYPLIYIPTQIQYHKIDDEINTSIDRISISKVGKIKVSRDRMSEASKRLSSKKIKDKEKRKTNNNIGTLMDIIGIVQ